MASAFEAVETVRSVLSILEQQLVVVELIEDILDRGLSVAIGAEHGFEPLAPCALVVAPVSIEGEVAGTIGVVGPTRMHYPRALAAVQMVGERLGEQSGRLARPSRLGEEPSNRRCPEGPGVEGPGVEGPAPQGAGRPVRRAVAALAVDYYALLGVPPEASDDDIKRAYRRMARELHPDSTGGDAAAEARFKEVSQAYEVLRDPERRARYDRFGSDPTDAVDPFFGSGLGGMFDAFFGGAGRRCPPVRSRSRGGRRDVLELTLREAVFGAERRSRSRCPWLARHVRAPAHGRGPRPSRAPNATAWASCAAVRQSILGQVVTAVPCRRCQGTGEVIPTPCPDCRGEGRRVETRTYPVAVPAGVDHGSTMRLSGRGPAGRRGGPAGDLFVHLAVTEDDRFIREGDDLHAEVHVSMIQAALGATVAFSTLDGDETIADRRGNPERSRNPFAWPWRASRPRAWARGSDGPGRGGHPDRSHQVTAGDASPNGGRARRADLPTRRGPHGAPALRLRLRGQLPALSERGGFRHPADARPRPRSLFATSALSR